MLPPNSFNKNSATKSSFFHNTDLWARMVLGGTSEKLTEHLPYF